MEVVKGLEATVAVAGAKSLKSLDRVRTEEGSRSCLSHTKERFLGLA